MSKEKILQDPFLSYRKSPTLTVKNPIHAQIQPHPLSDSFFLKDYRDICRHNASFPEDFTLFNIKSGVIMFWLATLPVPTH